MPDHNLLLAGLRPKRASAMEAAAIEPSEGVRGEGAVLRHPLLDRVMKRLFDAAVAALCLILLCPLFVLVALAIWSVDGGSPFYRHRRLGRGGRSFACLKFRSMRTDGDAVLARYLAANPAARAEWARTRKLKDDPRITAIGHMLRKSSLDELPQLVNILRGDMSLVGPRPIVEAEVEKYGDAAAAYFAVRPGLTGAWQVSGRSDTTYAERVRLDRHYVESRSFAGDIMIIMRTIPAVLLVKGSY